MSRFTLPLALMTFVLSGPSCPHGSVAILSPGTHVETYEFDVEVVATDSGLDTSGLVAQLNGTPLALVEGPPGHFHASVAPGPPLRDHNQLRVRIPRVGGHGKRTLVRPFRYDPPGKARARRIDDPDDLIRGPLAHGRVGDYLLENGTARFVVQDVGQRDFHSVGQYGGNLIDAELVGRPGLDNFFEIQPALNIESVINAQTATILNDGQDGTAALLETCGPDDLLDWTNPSDQISQFDFPAQLPPGIDDFDLPIEACTRYRIEPSRVPGEHPWVEMETTVFNLGGDDLRLFVGDYLNAMGQLEQWSSLDPASVASFDSGIGENVATLGLGVFSFFGFGEAQGVSYGRVGLPIGASSAPDSSFTDSGFSLILSGVSIPLILVFPPEFVPPPLVVLAGDSASFRRFFVVGDGDGGDLLDAEVELRGLAHGTVRGCVEAGAGGPAPGARITAGNVRDGQLSDVLSTWVADADGCYEGRLPVGSYGIAAARAGNPYEGGGPTPVVHPLTISDGGEAVQDFVLPASGRVAVHVGDETGAGLPARVTVVGFDPSPEPLITFSLFGVLNTDGGTFVDPTADRLPFGVAHIDYTDAAGHAAFELEPGSYRVFVSRGTEYSAHDQALEVVAGATTEVEARIARVLDTTGFVSSDFHVHLINSLDSRISARDRVRQLAGEGVENLVATEHDARTDLRPTIAALGFGPFLTATLGEEITTPSFGHYNAYPLGFDPTRPSGGSIDWGRAAPPGEDFPSLGAWNLTPAEIEAAVGAQTDAGGAPLNPPGAVVQINHITGGLGHFDNLKIDTSLEPPVSALTPAEMAAKRLDPAAGDLFHLFEALELWNGASRGAQSAFLGSRIGIWMNHLNQGLRTTFVADTDTHDFLALESAGAVTWTAAPSDRPDEIDPLQVAEAIRAGRAVGGQGLYVRARLREADDPGNEASFELGGTTEIQTAGDGAVELVIEVQAPGWSSFDTIEIYANAETVVTGTRGGVPVRFAASPSLTLRAGEDFVLPDPIVVHPEVPGATRRELELVVPFALDEDTWFVVLVRGTDGVSPPLFPIFPKDLRRAGNETLPGLLDGNLDQDGVLALGATNALFADVDGTPGFDPPGVRVAP
jgi:hypothetical protein